MRLRMGLQRKKRALRNLSKMSRKGSSKRKAVAPVLATLLMIAVAVAMSVIIFMWSQGFLSQTSSSTGSQQGAQNQAAQSSIAIEASIFNANDTASVVVRNVGSVGVTLGSLTTTGISSNAGYKGSEIKTYVDSGGNATLTKGSGVTIRTGVLTGLVSGDTVTLKVTTTAGTFAQATYTVP